ncbi:MAG: hypothetical protein H6600_01315 [Flavobacteriales bacterium]|nr:hypothetical protein [Flavobacteriales bacterium]
MKLIKITSIAMLALLSVNSMNAQLIGKKGTDVEMETDGKEAFDKGVQETREVARQKLKPYKYDGTKSTYFSYKTYTYAKEVEVITIEQTDYKLCFNSAMVTLDKIKVQIYDKPSTGTGRILLYEKDGIGADEFEVSLEDLNKVFRAEKAKTSNVAPEIIEKMRLKKVYINYIIPAVDREFETYEDNMGNTKKTTIIQYSAMVLAVGYLNL